MKIQGWMKLVFILALGVSGCAKSKTDKEGTDEDLKKRTEKLKGDYSSKLVGRWASSCESAGKAGGTFFETVVFSAAAKAEEKPKVEQARWTFTNNSCVGEGKEALFKFTYLVVEVDSSNNNKGTVRFTPEPDGPGVRELKVEMLNNELSIGSIVYYRDN